MYKKYLSIFFLLLLITMSAESAFHHHDDGHIDEDCEICLTLAHNSAFIGQDSSGVLQNNFNDTPVLFQEDVSLNSSDVTSGYSERAPPA